jgi:nitrate/nitrite-specific signal transduction histidine kinase
MVTADHLGLKIMRERAEAIGAEFNLYSEPGEGTQISVIWREPSKGPAAISDSPNPKPKRRPKR